MIVVLMGVSGSGKTTIGTHLARRINAPFVDADDFHSTANKVKMAAGQALTDEDRQPWLQALHAVLQGWHDAGLSGVMACSALKDAYRQTLAAGLPDVSFVLLDGSRELIAQRLASRHHEYMNPALLESQMQTLEVPAEGLRVQNERTPEAVVDEILWKLRTINGAQAV